MMKRVTKHIRAVFVCFLCILAAILVHEQPAMAEEDGIYGALPISANGSYSGRLSDDCVNYYQFTLQESGKVTLTISLDMSSSACHFYDNEYHKLCGGTIYYDENRRCRYTKENYYFPAGTYYLKITGSEGNYSFGMNFQSANETIPESQTNRNDILSEARNISLNTKYTALIGHGDTQDFFKFHVPFSGQVSISHSDYITNGHSNYAILNMEGDRLGGFGDYSDSNKGYAQGVGTVSLDAGDYYLKLYDTHGIYHFTIKPKPNPAQISHTKRNKSKATVYIEKQDGATGYVLNYSTTRDFKKGTAKTIKVTGKKVKLTRLKINAHYYLRVKAYKVWNGKTYYSEYGNTSTMYYY